MKLTSKQKFDFFDSFNWKCQICFCDLVFNPTPNHTPNSARIDHIIPKNKGGNNRKSNLSAVCSSCNTKKKDYLSSEYLETPSFEPAFFMLLVQYERRNGIKIKNLSFKISKKINELEQEARRVKSIAKELNLLSRGVSNEY
ncbi:MAG: HNH endonuclease [Gammaproteobacteria bacterium]|nr:HNH endonuclease [Gammaproteobacteria bacterium]